MNVLGMDYWMTQARNRIQHGIQPHFVYLAIASEDGFEPLLKIGTTTNLYERLQAIKKGGNSEPDWLADYGCENVQLLGLLDGDRELEGYLHKAFKEHRAGGEWFWFDPISAEVDDLLDDFCICPRCLLVEDLQQLTQHRTEASS